MRPMSTLLVVVSLIVAACTSSTELASTTTVSTTTSTATTTITTTPTTTAPTTTTTSPVEIVVPAGIGAFGSTLEDIPLITDGVYGGPSWPSSLTRVAGLDIVPEELRADLLERGFAIERAVTTFGDYDPAYELAWRTQWSAIYDQLSPYGGRAVFVTTDVAYHLWHQVFDFLLRTTEEQELLPVLEAMVADLVTAARNQAEALADDPVAGEAAQRAAEHLEVVATVLGLDVGPIGPRAAEEVQLVEQATRLTESPTVGGDCSMAPPTASCVDYSLAKPRGHYTRTDALERYFRAMSVLGNTGFSVTDVDTLRVGLLISRLITEDQVTIDAWSTIYGPTAFLVGTADDYTPFEAAAVAAAIVPSGLDDPTALDDASVVAIGTALLAVRDVGIDPQRASLRTMGSRFVVDSWIYDQLTDPGVSGRIRPTPLDLASVIGVGLAASIQDDAGVAATYPDYEARVAELRLAMAARTIDDWGASVYDAWLYALEPVWTDRYDDAFPPFMRGEAWDTKGLSTGLGSYTELKHDTILYAKQGVAEGEAPDLPPPPRHWVEPDPVAFGRLAAAARMMRDGLIDAGLLVEGDFDWTQTDPYANAEDRTRWSIEFLIDLVSRLQRLAADELEGKPISTEDNEWLSTFGSRVMWFVEALNAGGVEPTPLIADVFLDPFADEVLELGTGPQDTIHVLVPDDAGGFEVATGAVYSYYEFWGPRDSRMTDEEWWDTIITGDLPDRPSWWTDVFD